MDYYYHKKPKVTVTLGEYYYPEHIRDMEIKAKRLKKRTEMIINVAVVVGVAASLGVLLIIVWMA